MTDPHHHRTGNLDLDKATALVERSMEETAQGLRVKAPKIRHARRTVSIPASVIAILRAHRRQQNEQRLLLGLGGAVANDFVFTLGDGSPYPADKLAAIGGNVVRDRKLPRVMFHSLRHAHASALIAAGLDVVAVSRRPGHGSPAITLAIYAHQFGDRDEEAALAMDAALAGLAPKKIGLGSNLGPNINFLFG